MNAVTITCPEARFGIGTRVRKKSGAEWQGHVCGYYTAPKTPIGCAVHSERHHGSVQIYPETALELVPPDRRDIDWKLGHIDRERERLLRELENLNEQEQQILIEREIGDSVRTSEIQNRRMIYEKDT